MRYLFILLISLSFLQAYGVWTQQSDRGLALMGIQALDNQRAWIAGTSQSLAAIYFTTNGGNNWNSSNAAFSMLWMDIAFDPTSKWGIVGGLGLSIMGWSQIALTTNGGSSWTKKDPTQTLTTEVKAVQFIAPTTYLAVANVGQNSTPELWISTNLGNNWTRKTLNHDNYCQDLHFFNTSTGFVVMGDWPDDVQNMANQYRLYKNPMKKYAKTANQYRCSILFTSDGGNHWTVQYDDIGHFYGFGISMVNQQEGWVACDGYGGAGSRILHTNNGGSSWLEQTIPDGGRTYFLSDVHFVDNQCGWAVGGASSGVAICYIMHTIDGGTNWIKDSFAPVGPAMACHFPNKSSGWAVGANDVTQTGRIYLYLDKSGISENKYSESIPLKMNINCSPNPVSRNANVSFSLSESGNTTLKIYDLQGKCRKTLLAKFLDKGNHNIGMNIEELRNGSYFLVMNQGNNKKAITILKVE
ncbi:MAG: T9SS type A sorting domain-containing protein [Candidatus Coatesbacteria bacterium]|nr:T9SS type A sorting domain-containing protein [Candidatus Coatesbacteria bacterium]